MKKLFWEYILPGFVILCLFLMAALVVRGQEQKQPRKTHVETITEYFSLSQCPDDVETGDNTDNLRNRWRVDWDDDENQGTATCRHLVYDEETQ